MTKRTPTLTAAWLLPSATLLATLLATCCPLGADEPLDIGTRRELFVDGALIDKLEGDVQRRLHHPRPESIVLQHDAPWEGSGSGYHSIFRDGDLYRMYYKAWHLKVEEGKLKQPHALFMCYAESKDGIHWVKPNLGLYEFNGSKQNNIALASEPMEGPEGMVNPDAGHPAVFKDANPDCPPESLYKAIIRSRGPKGLLAFHSADGIHWKPMRTAPIITYGAFDSQNLAFWDPTSGQYRAYFRYFTENRRDILTATSPDFLNWSKPRPVTYPGADPEHLYTNQVYPYHRAPHLLIGFPTRYVDRGWSPSMEALPELEHRKLRSSSVERYGTAVTEGLLMSSRDGHTFERWGEAFLRPGIQRPGTWHYGHQYLGWHVVETKSALEGAPPELSLYATESYWTGEGDALRRYTLRLDGFVSMHAGWSGGTVTTRPLQFSGNHLEMNFASSAAGGIRVQFLDQDGQPLSGKWSEPSDVVFGDEISRVVTWKGESDLSQLAGKTIRIRFKMKDADLYSFRFASER